MIGENINKNILFFLKILSISIVLISCNSRTYYPSLIFDDATKFKKILELKAEQLRLSHENLLVFDYSTQRKSSYQIILIPEGITTKKDLIESGVSLEFIQQIFINMNYLDRVHDDYLIGNWIIIFREKNNILSWTGSEIQPSKILFSKHQNTSAKIILHKINNKVEIVEI